MKFNKFLTIVFLMSVFALSSVAQKEVEKGDAAYEVGDYAEAIELYREGYAKIKNDKAKKAEVVFRIGDCYQKTSNPKKAELWFRKAISRKYPDPVVYLYYGDVLKMNEKYEEAVIQYQKYREEVPDDDRGRVGEESCKMAAEWKANPTRHIVENMAFFNSKEADFSPAFAKKDYKVMLFTSSREGATGDQVNKVSGQLYFDIFTTTLDRKGKWSVPTPLGENVNSEYDEGSSWVNKKGSTMFFTRCRREKGKNIQCQIYTARKKGMDWDMPVLVNIAADTVDVKHPALSPDEKTLYFSAEMPGGYGGKDIWMMKREKDRKPFGEPINLGPEINTQGNEMFPTVRPNGDLYFSSDEHLGMGGFDIFKAIPDENGKYEIINLQYPINSSADDFGMIFSGNKEMGFFSSSRPGGKGKDDIYSFKLPPLQFSISGYVKDEKTGEEIVGAKVKVKGDDGFMLEMSSEADGSYKFKLSPDVEYMVTAAYEGYFLGKVTLSTKEVNEDKDFLQDITIKKIIKTEDIPLPNIEYDFGKATLRPESMVELDKLVETMNDNPTITIELNSHTDYVGSDEANMKLSDDRAKSVVDYLISKGIEQERMTWKGMGESEPKTVQEADNSIYPFLEIGTVLTEEFIKGLSEENQVGANQLNRRTSFKVVSTDYIPKTIPQEEAPVDSTSQEE